MDIIDQTQPQPRGPNKRTTLSNAVTVSLGVTLAGAVLQPSKCNPQRQTPSLQFARLFRVSRPPHTRTKHQPPASTQPQQPPSHLHPPQPM